MGSGDAATELAPETRHSPLSLPDFVSSGPHSHTSSQTMLKSVPSILCQLSYHRLKSSWLVSWTQQHMPYPFAIPESIFFYDGRLIHWSWLNIHWSRINIRKHVLAWDGDSLNTTPCPSSLQKIIPFHRITGSCKATRAVMQFSSCYEIAKFTLQSSTKGCIKVQQFETLHFCN